MKKIIAFSLSLVFTMILLVPNVYATASYKVDLKATKNNTSGKEEVVVNVELSDVNVEGGLIAFGATLDYDKNILEYKEVKEGNWSAPYYNENTGKLVTERNDLTKNNEEMFSIIFDAKVDLSNQTPTVTLKNIEASDGQSDIKTEDKSIQIGDVPVEEPEPPTPEPPSDDNQGGNSQGGNNQEDNNLGSGNVESSSNNSSSTTNNNSSNSSGSSKVKTPSSGDMLPVIAIGVILIIFIANVIVIVIRKKKKSEK